MEAYPFLIRSHRENMLFSLCSLVRRGRNGGRGFSSVGGGPVASIVTKVLVLKRN